MADGTTKILTNDDVTGQSVLALGQYTEALIQIDQVIANSTGRSYSIYGADVPAEGALLNYKAAKDIVVNSSQLKGIYGGTVNSKKSLTSDGDLRSSSQNYTATKSAVLANPVEGGTSSFSGPVVGYNTLTVTGTTVGGMTFGGKLSISSTGVIDVSDFVDTGIDVSSITGDIVAFITQPEKVSFSVDSSGTLTVDSSKLDNFVFGYENASLNAATVKGMIGGKVSASVSLSASLSRNVSITASASLSSTAEGALDLQEGSTVKTAATGYKTVTMGGSTAGYLVGGNLSANLSAKASNVKLVNDNSTVSAGLYAALSASLASQGSANLSDGSKATLAAGYTDVTLAGSDLKYAVGGKLNVSAKIPSAKISDLKLSGISVDTVLKAVSDAGASASVSLNSAGVFTAGTFTTAGDTPVTTASTVSIAAGFRDVILNDVELSSGTGPSGIFVGGKLNASASLDYTPADLSKRYLTVGGSISASLNSDGSFTSTSTPKLVEGDLADLPDFNIVAGYENVTLENADASIVLGGSVSGSVSGSVTTSGGTYTSTDIAVPALTGPEVTISKAKISLSSKADGAASVNNEKAWQVYSDDPELSVAGMIGYSNLSVTAAQVNIAAGGNISGSLSAADAVIGTKYTGTSSEGAWRSEKIDLQGRASLSASVAATGTATFNAGTYTDTVGGTQTRYAGAETSLALGYQDVYFYGSNGQNVIGGNLSISGRVDSLTFAQQEFKGTTQSSYSTESRILSFKNASLSGSLSSRGTAVIANPSVPSEEGTAVYLPKASRVDTLAGYKDVIVDGGSVGAVSYDSSTNSRVGTAIGGNLSISASGTLDDLDLESMSSTLVKTLFYGDHNVSISGSLASGGSMTVMNGAKLATGVGYQNLSVDHGFLDTAAVAGNLSVSGSVTSSDSTNKKGVETAKRNIRLGASLNSNGTASITNSTEYDDDAMTATLVGYRTLNMGTASAGVAVAGNISLSASANETKTTVPTTVEGGTATVTRTASGAVSASYSANGTASLSASTLSGFAAGYSTVKADSSTAGIMAGGSAALSVSLSKFSDLLATKNSVTASGSFSASASSSGKLTVSGASDISNAIGYADVNVSGASSVRATGGNLSVSGTFAYAGGNVTTGEGEEAVTAYGNTTTVLGKKLSYNASGKAVASDADTKVSLRGYKAVELSNGATGTAVYGGNFSGSYEGVAKNIDYKEMLSEISKLVSGGGTVGPQLTALRNALEAGTVTGYSASAGTLKITSGAVLKKGAGYDNVTVIGGTVGTLAAGRVDVKNVVAGDLLGEDGLNAVDYTQTATGKFTASEGSIIKDIYAFKNVTIQDSTLIGSVAALYGDAKNYADGQTGSSVTFSNATLTPENDHALSGYSAMNLKGTNYSFDSISSTKGNDRLAIQSGTTTVWSELDFGKGKDTIDIAKGSAFVSGASTISGLEQVTGKGDFYYIAGSIDSSVKIASTVKKHEVESTDAFDHGDDEQNFAYTTASGELTALDTVDWRKFTVTDLAALDITKAEGVSATLLQGTRQITDFSNLTAGDYTLKFAYGEGVEAFDTKYSYALTQLA